MSYIRSLAFVDQPTQNLALDSTEGSESQFQQAQLQNDRTVSTIQLSNNLFPKQEVPVELLVSWQQGNKSDLQIVVASRLVQQLVQRHDARMCDPEVLLEARRSLAVEVLQEGRCILSRNRGSVWKELLNCCWNRAEVQTFITVELKKDSLNRKSWLFAKLLEGSRRQFGEFNNDIGQLLTSSTQNTSIDLKVGMDQKHISVVQAASNPSSITFDEVVCYPALCQLVTKHYQQEVTKFQQEFRLTNNKLKQNPSLQPILLIRCVVSTQNKLSAQLLPRMPLFDKDVVYYLIQKHLCLYANCFMLATYAEKFKLKDNAFDAKRSLLSRKSPSECLQFLDIKPRYQLLSPSSPSIPYQSSISILSQLNQPVSLRGLLTTIQHYYSQIKINCYDFHHGGEEISTMDDILPVMIYTVLRCQVKSLYAIVQLVQDYARVMESFDVDLRVLTNLGVAIEYITNEWKLQ